MVPRYGIKKSTDPIQNTDSNAGEGSSSSDGKTTAERALQYYLVGSSLDDALEADADDVEIFWPFRSENKEVGRQGDVGELKRRRQERDGDEVDWRGREAIL